MSKTAQRKASQFALGKSDAMANRGFRWIRHPYIRSYRAGYSAGRRKYHMKRWREITPKSLPGYARVGIQWTLRALGDFLKERLAAWFCRAMRRSDDALPDYVD